MISLQTFFLCGTLSCMTESATIKDVSVDVQPANADVAALYQAGMHFGYAKTRRHPGMRSYIFGTKNNVEVFDLYKVLPKLEEALDAMRIMGREGKTLLFVGTKASAKEAVRNAAQKLDMPYVAERWLGGTLTNFKVITDRVQYWQDLKRQKESGELKKYTKHEQAKFAQHINKLEFMFKGLEGMKRFPDALFVVDVKEEGLAIHEATRRNVPVLALSNTDTDPSLATYIIPGNDNAKASIVLILERAAHAYQEGAAMKTSVEPVSGEASTGV